MPRQNLGRAPGKVGTPSGVRHARAQQPPGTAVCAPSSCLGPLSHVPRESACFPGFPVPGGTEALIQGLSAETRERSADSPASRRRWGVGTQGGLLFRLQASRRLRGGARQGAGVGTLSRGSGPSQTLPAALKEQDKGHVPLTGAGPGRRDVNPPVETARTRLAAGLPASPILAPALTS